MTHPYFVVGLVSYFLFLTREVSQVYNSVLGLQIVWYQLFWEAFWIGSLIDVCTDAELKSDQ
jgi:hypothetical protein